MVAAVRSELRQRLGTSQILRQKSAKGQDLTASPQTQLRNPLDTVYVPELSHISKIPHLRHL